MAFEGVHRIGHVGIWVSDIEKSLDWYRNVVGLKLTGLWGEPFRRHRQCFVRCEDWHHDIVFFEIDKSLERKDLDYSDTGKRHKPGVHHIAFEIPEREDWINALEDIKKKGIPFVSGPYVHGHESNYVQDTDELAFVGGSGSHAFYICDPDGNRLEFYTWMMKVTKKSVAAPNPDF